MAFVHYNLYLNKLHCSKNVFYANSMSITVCKNRYISSHKVSKGFANRGGNQQKYVFSASNCMESTPLTALY